MQFWKRLKVWVYYGLYFALCFSGSPPERCRRGLINERWFLKDIPEFILQSAVFLSRCFEMQKRMQTYPCVVNVVRMSCACLVWGLIRVEVYCIIFSYCLRIFSSSVFQHIFLSGALFVILCLRHFGCEYICIIHLISYQSNGLWHWIVNCCTDLVNFHSLGDGLHARISISYWYFLNKMLWNLRLRSISHLVLLDSGVICCTASLLSPVKKEHIFPKAHDEAFKSSHPISNHCCICVFIFSLSLISQEALQPLTAVAMQKW